MSKLKIIGVMFLLVLMISIIGIYATRNLGKTGRVVSQENAEQRMDKMVKRINPKTGNPSKSAIDYSEEENAADELPDIDTCPITADETTNRFAEIYSSPSISPDPPG